MGYLKICDYCKQEIKAKHLSLKVYTGEGSVYTEWGILHFCNKCAPIKGNTITWPGNSQAVEKPD